VLDVDSPERARFGDEEVAGLEALAARYVESVA
jgi:putative methionine-R-sulfoxide reductase with GAF domain